MGAAVATIAAMTRTTMTLQLVLAPVAVVVIRATTLPLLVRHLGQQLLPLLLLALVLVETVVVEIIVVTRHHQRMIEHLVPHRRKLTTELHQLQLHHQFLLLIPENLLHQQQKIIKENGSVRIAELLK